MSIRTFSGDPRIWHFGVRQQGFLASLLEPALREPTTPILAGALAAEIVDGVFEGFWRSAEMLPAFASGCTITYLYSWRC